MNVEEILGRARRAQPGWEALSVTERLARLNPLRSSIVDQSANIIEALCDDVGKTPLDALSGDILVTLEFLAFSEATAPKALASKRVSRDKFLYWNTKFFEEYFPFGTVLVLSPWNYPFQLSLIPTLSALIAGNAVILKTSNYTPKTTFQIDRLLKSLDLPTGLVQVLCGDSKLGENLIHGAPDLIFFTGSSAGGRSVAIESAKRLIPSIMELGGKDVAIVFSDAPLERTVEGITFAAFANCGQVCVGTKRILIDKSIEKEFVNLFLERCAKLQIGNQPDSDFGFPSRALQINKMQEYVNDAVEKGARLLSPLPLLPLKGPVILTNVPENAKISHDEVFGPIVCIETFSDEDEIIHKVNNSEYGLGASIWTEDRALSRRIAHALKVGSCSINDAIFQVGNPAASFGGVRSSGWGRYRGEAGFRSFCNIRSVMERTRLRKHERHWFLANSKTFKDLKSIISLKHGRNKIIKKLFQSIFIYFTLICTPSVLGSQEHGTLNIIVSGFKENDGGEIAYAVFDHKKHFPSNKDLAFTKGFVAATPRTSNGTLEIKIHDIPYGKYALSIYLDLNGDHKLNKSFLGIPLEPAGVSRNPAWRLGPPLFKDSVIEFNSKSEPFYIRLMR